ncbi:agouti-signaling protein-like [Cottoperca gobio]|uniref:Agouti-signaling protein n=1 Tax=Cottoperca gobio TaxID=56716 RepID=A0A6J2PKM2_COTGO|nr:agouti-signaling protein-like [Cottoperca gobio]
MHAFLLLVCFVLAATEYSFSSAHMIPDECLPTNKTIIVKKRPPPPANCIPLWGSCKSPSNVCCDFCAFCRCQLFRTVCYCRMGNPRC